MGGLLGDIGKSLGNTFKPVTNTVNSVLKPVARVVQPIGNTVIDLTRRAATINTTFISQPLYTAARVAAGQNVVAATQAGMKDPIIKSLNDVGVQGSGANRIAELVSGGESLILTAGGLSAAGLAGPATTAVTTVGSKAGSAIITAGAAKAVSSMYGKTPALPNVPAIPAQSVSEAGMFGSNMSIFLILGGLTVIGYVLFEGRKK